MVSFSSSHYSAGWRGPSAAGPSSGRKRSILPSGPGATTAKLCDTVPTWNAWAIHAHATPNTTANTTANAPTISDVQPYRNASTDATRNATTDAPSNALGWTWLLPFLSSAVLPVVSHFHCPSSTREGLLWWNGTHGELEKAWNAVFLFSPTTTAVITFKSNALHCCIKCSIITFNGL